MWHTYWLNWMDILDSAVFFGILGLLWRAQGPLMPPPFDRFLQGMLAFNGLMLWVTWLGASALFLPYLGLH